MRQILGAGGGAIRLEVTMKNSIAILALAGVVLASPAWADKICLNTRDIVSSKSTDGKLLVFTMRDGRTMVNHLQGVCPDLKFNGFVWTIRDTNQVCEKEQSLQVLRSGQTCVLGKFDAPMKQATAQ
jgi:hypothetical protein